MPLEHAKPGTPGFHANIEEMVRAGHPVESAVAAAYRASGERNDGIDRVMDALGDLLSRVDAEWNEGDHPRSEDGKFGSGSGSAPKKQTKEQKKRAAEGRANFGKHMEGEAYKMGRSSDADFSGIGKHLEQNGIEKGSPEYNAVHQAFIKGFKDRYGVK